MDQDAALAWALRERERCGGCGVVRSDVIDPETNQPIDPPPYLPIRWHCPSCAALERLRDEIDESPTKRPPGQSVALLPRETVERITADW